LSVAAPQALHKRAAEEGCEVVVVSAKVESELNGMPAEEAKEWLEMLGVEPGEGGGLGALICASYKTLGLQTYFTTGVYVLLLLLPRLLLCFGLSLRLCPLPMFHQITGR
jgi:ribosome-binding ATPase YchF (GTP1/OBG family)